MEASEKQTHSVWKYTCKVLSDIFFSSGYIVYDMVIALKY